MKVKTPKIKTSNFSNFFVKIGSNTLIQVFVLFVVLIGINIVSQKYFVRIDLTENKIYTLSEGTKNILGSLEDDIKLEIYFSDNIPPDLLSVRQATIDLYEEFERYSNGKVESVVKDPTDVNFREDALEAGVPEVQYQEFSQDQYAISKGFLGAAVRLDDTSEAIELITEENIQNLEYETTSRIYKLTNEEKTRVGFLTGHGEKSIDTEYTTITKLLSNQFEVENVSIENGKPINPEEIKILVIAAPTTDLSKRDRFEIDQYIVRGGRVIFLTDDYQLDYQNPVLNKTESNYSKFIKNYGVEVNQAVMLDESFLPLRLIFTYPFWVLTQRENLDTNNPALANLDSLVFYWGNPLTESEEVGDKKVTALIKTTDKAWAQTGDTILVDPSQNFSQGNQQQFTISYLIEGKQVSVFKGKDIPKLEGEEKDQRKTKDERKDVNDDMKIVVVGDSDFISDDLMSGSEQNGIFFQNLIEWFSASEDLISIRSKNISTRALDVTSDSQKTLVKVVNIALIPVIVIILGVVYNTIRRKRKSRI